MPKAFILYRIWYDSPNGEYIAYVGRTKTTLAQRFRGHVFGHPFQKKVDILGASKIEYAEFET